MSMIQSRNPTMQVFDKPRTLDDLDQAQKKLNSMSIGGTVFATSILLAICSAFAILTWGMFVEMLTTGNMAKTFPWLIGSGLGGFVLVLVISFKPRTAPFLAPVYAGVEGVFLAGISAILAARYLGGVDDPAALATIGQAVGLTLSILGGLLIAYAAGLIRIGGTVAKVMMAALCGVILYALVLMIGNGIFGAGIPNMIDSPSPMGIGFSVFLVALASLFLVLDFQRIEAGVKNQAPKYMNWYGAFGLMVTIVWLYIEVLRLLLKLKSHD